MMGGLSFIGFMIFNILVIDPKTNKARMSAKEIWTAVVLVIKTTFNISNLGIPSFLKPSFWKERTVSLRAVFIMAFSNGFGFAMVFPIFSLFFYQFYNLSEEFIGTIFGIVGLIGVVFNPIGGWVSDRTNKKVVVLFTGLISGILMGFAGFQFSIMLIIGLFTARQIVQQMNMPSFRALQADLVEPEKRGLEFGNVQMFFNTGSILGPILGGILYDKFSEQEFTFMGLQAFGVEYLFLITSSLAIIATIVLIIFVKKRDFVVNKLKENKEEYSFIAKE